MPISIALLLGLAMMQSVPMPSPILLIAREPLVAGRENAYREIEEETARLSARLGCPHPYLAMESLTGPKEIWWFNGFDSPEDQRQVAEAYERNALVSGFRKRPGSVPIWDSGEQMRNNVAWERGRPACRSKEAIQPRISKGTFVAYWSQRVYGATLVAVTSKHISAADSPEQG